MHCHLGANRSNGSSEMYFESFRDGFECLKIINSKNCIKNEDLKKIIFGNFFISWGKTSNKTRPNLDQGKKLFLIFFFEMKRRYAVMKDNVVLYMILKLISVK